MWHINERSGFKELGVAVPIGPGAKTVFNVTIHKKGIGNGKKRTDQNGHVYFVIGKIGAAGDVTLKVKGMAEAVVFFLVVGFFPIPVAPCHNVPDLLP